VIPPDLSLAEQESGRFHGLARQRVAWGRLDEAGAYRIRGVPAGTYRVATTGEVPGWFHAWSEPFELRAGETVTVPDLVLAPNPNVISGRVLASDGGRPKGVDLRYADADSSGTAERPWLSGSVGRDGAFEIAFETPGAHDLYFCGPPDQARGELLVRGVVTGTRDLELRLGEPASMELAVQGEDGGRLADFGYAVHWVGMEGFGSSLSFTNHPTGRLRIPVRALPFVLRVTGSDHLPEDVGPFDTMHHPEEVVVRLRSMPSLSARVLFEGRPIEGASVSLQSIAPPGRLQACNGFPCRFEDYASPRTTDADGRCTIRAGDPGRRALLVRAEGYAEAETEAFDFDPNAPGAEHAIELARGGSLEGRVLPRGGSSAEGILVGISRGDGVCRIVRVAADGRYRFERLAAGTWWLRRCPRDYVAEGGYSYEVVEGFDPSLAETRVEDGRTTSFDLDLRDAFAVVEGRFSIESGAAAAWTVRLVEPGENPQGQDGGRLDAGGEFHFDAERLGPHTLVFRLVADDRDQEIEVPLAIERGVRRVDVAVATGTIEGTARPGASIEHVWLGSPPTRGLAHWGADASGRFRVEGVPAGRGTLSIVEHGTRSAAVAVDVPDGGTVRVELR
jgi:hypothetical protein